MKDNGNHPASPLTGDAYTDYSHYDGTNKSSYNPECQGLTKREYFAGLAPQKIPEWFDFAADLSFIKKPELTDHQLKMMDEYNSDNYGLSEEDFNTGSSANAEMSAYYSKTSIETKKQRYFAWKVFHADELLKELLK